VQFTVWDTGIFHLPNNLHICYIFPEILFGCKPPAKIDILRLLGYYLPMNPLSKNIFIQKIRFSFFLILILFLSGSGKTTATENTLPFKPGEIMTFHVKWAFIPAGDAVLEVLPVETFNGEKSYHFLFTARTNEYVDLIYKVRDRVDSYTDIGMTHSLMYRKQHQAGSTKDVVVNFNWELNQAQYSNFGEKLEPVTILPGAFDPLSVFFAFRIYDLNNNIEVETPVTDGKKCIIGKAKKIKEERIKVAGGTFDTFLIEPEMEHIGGVFKKSKGAKLQIWVTSDKRRIPVKIKSKVIVGSFVAELVSYEISPVQDNKVTE